jgi:hypothetical protein
VLNLTNPPGAPEITRTYYFRTQFTAPEFRDGTILRFEPLVDDGAVFYLNGAEFYRLNMTEVPALITYGSSALLPRNNGQLVYQGPYEIPATNLIVGENLFAAEVHQYSLDSSDMAFGARVTAIIPPRLARLQIASSEAGFMISWTGAGYVLEEAPSLEVAWTISRNQENPQLQRLPGGRFFRLRRE